MVENELLAVGAAIEVVLKHVVVLAIEEVPLLEAPGRILAQPAISRDNLPPFANSAMDGYAVRVEDISAADPANPVRLRVVADVAAGAPSEVEITEGTAARIMTGAELPQGANGIVPVEDTSEPWRDPARPLPRHIDIGRSVKRGDYIRWPGEDVEAGSTVLPAGRLLRAQDIGLLASLGHATISVIRRPRVGILATGDELIDVEEPLSAGKIRNSNSFTQAAQALALGAVPHLLGRAGDDESEVVARLDEGLSQGVDIFISSAGVSVGAFDVVRNVLEREGSLHFWRVNMRPGKPLAFGAYGGVPYLGLPGNPVSAMVSFERFARPAILKMAGHINLERPTIPVEMREEIHSDGRESYIRAVVDRGRDGYLATTTGSQGSHMMTSLTQANALVIVPQGVKHVASGSQLTAMMIDWPSVVF